MKPLAQRAAELFSPKPWDHRWNGAGAICGVCLKCNKTWAENGHIREGICPIPNPIDITDLGKALECFRGLSMKSFELLAYVRKVRAKAKANDHLEFGMWVLRKATAEQIWEICCLAKERETKK